MLSLVKKIVNKILMKGAVRTIPNGENAVFLTFDDGPEPDITEFVLEELAKYDFKATFFCKGKNAIKYPNLIEKIKMEQHAIGNHSFSHVKAYDLSGKAFSHDIEKADQVLQTHIMRPPNGCLRLSSWLRLRKKYKTIYWSIDSGDWHKENFNAEKSIHDLQQTTTGDIILFHFSQNLQMGTRKLLPDYLKWLKEHNLHSEALK